jgi:ribosome-associated translation inhibitor RaiA
MMKTPLEIHCEKDIQLSTGLENDLRARIDKMDQHCNGQLIHCRAHVGQGTNAHHNTGSYDFRLTVDVSGAELAASKQDPDLHVAMRQACKAMLRQIDEHWAKIKHREGSETIRTEVPDLGA